MKELEGDMIEKIIKSMSPLFLYQHLELVNVFYHFITHDNHSMRQSLRYKYVPR